jgi:hypothetical protein
MNKRRLPNKRWQRRCLQPVRLAQYLSRFCCSTDSPPLAAIAKRAVGRLTRTTFQRRRLQCHVQCITAFPRLAFRIWVKLPASSNAVVAVSDTNGRTPSQRSVRDTQELDELEEEFVCIAVVRTSAPLSTDLHGTPYKMWVRPSQPSTPPLVSQPMPIVGSRMQGRLQPLSLNCASSSYPSTAVPPTRQRTTQQPQSLGIHGNLSTTATTPSTPSACRTTSALSSFQ